MRDYIPALIVSLAFVSVAGIIFVLGQIYSAYAHIQRRLPASTEQFLNEGVPARASFHSFVTKHFDEKRFRVDGSFHSKLRQNLLKAGYFSPDAVNFYLFARIASIIGFLAFAFILLGFFPDDLSWAIKLVFVSVTAFVGIAGPDAYIARRHRQLVERFRLDFPDFLDLLVVCVDAGLTIEAAFERVGSEITKRSRALGQNLEIMGAEMRAGRSIVEALESLAERLGLEESRTFVSMLRQSIELGTDVAVSLRVFSEEMRDKRLLRAEETANKLSVKLVLPLGLFIFPVVLLTVMLPVVLKLSTVLR
jgi:tight adherence protein C